jgi:antitoxin (DNA-binding transcriptional repressor) of toxin-antitoxin stability system
VIDVACETCYTNGMTTVTVRDLRQRWPETEKALQTDEEIVVTRDGKPVAKLIRYSEPVARRPRLDGKKHLAELKKITNGRVLPDRTAIIAAARDRFGR